MNQDARLRFSEGTMELRRLMNDDARWLCLQMATADPQVDAIDPDERPNADEPTE